MDTMTDLFARFEQLNASDDDRAFLRRANVGSELMKPEDQERVRCIARD